MLERIAREILSGKRPLPPYPLYVLLRGYVRLMRRFYACLVSLVEWTGAAIVWWEDLTPEGVALLAFVAALAWGCWRG
jgi:hypothetical protein